MKRGRGHARLGPKRGHVKRIGGKGKQGLKVYQKPKKLGFKK